MYTGSHLKSVVMTPWRAGIDLENVKPILEIMEHMLFALKLLQTFCSIQKTMVG